MKLPTDQNTATDASELRRGVTVTYVGYLVKLGMPLLLACATRAYGAERWGIYASVYAVVLVALRVSLLALDRGILRASAAHEPRVALQTVRFALLCVSFTSCLACAALWFTAAAGLFPGNAHAAVLRVVSLGLPPFALSEVLLHATMGRRRMEFHVAIRHTSGPLLHVVVALAFARCGLTELGLAWAFVVAQFTALALSVLSVRHVFGRTIWLEPRSWELPPGLFRYVMPLWFSEMANSVALRLDMFVLVALADPATLGVWAIISRFADAFRQMRRAYDPVVTALSARIAAMHDPQRLATTFTYAAQMVSLTQLPLFAGFVCFADLLLPLYGRAFAAGTLALLVLSSFFLLSGGAGLAGPVINGYGRTGLTLINVLIGLLVQLVLLLWFVPRYSLVGVAFAVGISQCIVNLVQAIELRIVTGALLYSRRSVFSAGVTFGSTAALALGVWVPRCMHFESWVWRAAGLSAFAAAYASLCALGLQKGLLRAPDAINPKRKGPKARGR